MLINISDVWQVSDNVVRQLVHVECGHHLGGLSSLRLLELEIEISLQHELTSQANLQVGCYVRELQVVGEVKVREVSHLGEVEEPRLTRLVLAVSLEGGDVLRLVCQCLRWLAGPLPLAGWLEDGGVRGVGADGSVVHSQRAGTPHTTRQAAQSNTLLLTLHRTAGEAVQLQLALHVLHVKLLNLLADLVFFH